VVLQTAFTIQVLPDKLYSAEQLRQEVGSESEQLVHGKMHCFAQAPDEVSRYPFLHVLHSPLTHILQLTGQALQVLFMS
jgi:hypothetical protein